ncbi:diguanylate cyclase [Escherichia coli]|nr:diguanylate cyclase [Escherichia coli]
MFGDQLLRDVSLAILSCLEHDQVLARPGGDEFLVLASQYLTKRAGSNGITNFDPLTAPLPHWFN